MTHGAIMKEPFNTLLSRLESVDFDTLVNVASDLATALRIVSSHPDVMALVRACEDDPQLVAAAYERLEDLCRRPVDPRYTSPFDSAIFALLFVLDRCEPFAAAKPAAAALDAANTYFSARFADKLLDGLVRIMPLNAAKETWPFSRREVPVVLHQPRSTLTKPIQEVAFS